MKFSGLKHAFAVDPPGPAQPTPEQQPAIDALCRRVMRFGLQNNLAPLMLDMTRPYNFLMSQTGHFFSPALRAILPGQMHADFKHLMEFLENRGALEYLQVRLEELDELDAAEREAQAMEASTDSDSEEIRRDGAGDDTAGRGS